MTRRSADRIHPHPPGDRETDRRRRQISRMAERGRASPQVFAAEFGYFLLNEVPDSFGIEFVLASEVSIETAVRQTCFRHDLVDRDVGKPLTVEQSGGASDDSLSGLVLVIR